MSEISVDFHLDQTELAAMLSSPGGPVGRHLRQLGYRVAMEAKRRAPNKTGKLRNSINYKSGPLGSIEISASVDYALAVHEGTGPHEIAGNPILKFPSRRGGGKFMYAPVVHHPGTKPNRFLSEALDKVMRSTI